MKYAIKVTCKEMADRHNNPICRDDLVVWITVGNFGNTSVHCSLVNLSYLLVFDTSEEAQEVASKWWHGYHPWYYVPKNVEVVAVNPLYERITGWEEA